MKHFLIIQTAFIGDVILSTGIVESIGKELPNAKIDILVRKDNESLLNNNPYINRVLIWNKKQNKYKNLYKIWKIIRANNYSHIINLQRFVSTGIITTLSGAKQTIGFTKNPFSFFFTKKIKHHFSTKENPIHEIDRNFSLIKHLCIKRQLPKLYPSHDDISKIKSFKTQQYICIAPSSIWYTKQWPVYKWIELILKIHNKFTIFLLGGKEDYELCENIKQKTIPKKVKNYAGKLNFLQSAQLMKNATMNYVNDSAPMHLASSINAPITAIYCSTIPEFGFGPLSQNSIIIETKKQLKCRPCGLHGKAKCPKKHFNCANQISISEVIN